MAESAKLIAIAFVRAINRQNVEALADLMTEDHRFIDALDNQFEGREKMRAGWDAYFRMVPDYTIAVEETFCDGPVVVMLGRVRGTYSPDGSIKEENRWQAPAALRAIIKENKVAEWRVYCDNEPMRQLMAKRA